MTLGVIVGAIRAATAHPLQAIADDLDEVNMYCRRYHHAENPDAATESIDDAELQEYVRRTLRVVGCLHDTLQPASAVFPYERSPSYL